MNFNIIGYSIYITAIFYITVFIGKKFHAHGRVFLHEILIDHSVCEAVNNILLVAYYLLNIGNAIVMSFYTCTCCFAENVQPKRQTKELWKFPILITARNSD